MIYFAHYARVRCFATPESDVDGITTCVTSHHDDVIGYIVVNKSKLTKKKKRKKENNRIEDRGSNNQIEH